MALSVQLNRPSQTEARAVCTCMVPTGGHRGKKTGIGYMRVINTRAKQKGKGGEMGGRKHRR